MFFFYFSQFPHFTSVITALHFCKSFVTFSLYWKVKNGIPLFLFTPLNSLHSFTFCTNHVYPLRSLFLFSKFGIPISIYASIWEDQLYSNNLLLNLFPCLFPFSIFNLLLSNPKKPDFNNIFIKKEEIFILLSPY